MIVELHVALTRENNSIVCFDVVGTTYGSNYSS